ncbi:MAG TPA: permease, partial [Fusibacter sp.]|nr:permease [Fusibacter sp.]
FIIPMDFQMPFLSEDSFLSVLIGATVGLPLYINSASSLPLMQSMVASGVSESAIFAFLIAGKATGIPVIIGMMTFLKKRAIAFYVGVIWVGAVIAGSISIILWKIL